MMSTELSETPGYVLQIHIPSGIRGLSVVSKDNWNGQGALFSRNSYSSVRVNGPFDFERTGVYVLWEPADEGELPRVYVGEADNLRQRLDWHLGQTDFWTNAVAFCSSDQNLNKAHVRHIEARLLTLAEEAKRCELQNKNATTLPSLSPSDKDRAENYLSDMLLCLPSIGVDFFEETKLRSPNPKDLYIAVKGATHATGYEDTSGFVVRKGSRAVKEEGNPETYPSQVKLRRALKDRGVLKDAGGSLEFVEDFTFRSPSAASGIILGGSTNGRLVWKDRDGRTLKKIQEEEANAE